MDSVAPDLRVSPNSLQPTSPSHEDVQKYWLFSAILTPLMVSVVTFYSSACANSPTFSSNRDGPPEKFILSDFG